MENLTRLIAVIAAVLLVVGIATFLFFRSSIASESLYRIQTAVGLDASMPERHVVPEGFQGWAVVHFSVEGAPPLGQDEETLILEYPATGRLETSTAAPNAEGFIQRGYYRHSADGLLPMSRMSDIWGEYTHRSFRDYDDDAAGRRSSGFFVGTLKEFRATDWPPEHGLPVGQPG